MRFSLFLAPFRRYMIFFKGLSGAVDSSLASLVSGCGFASPSGIFANTVSHISWQSKGSTMFLIFCVLFEVFEIIFLVASQHTDS